MPETISSKASPSPYAIITVAAYNNNAIEMRREIYLKYINNSQAAKCENTECIGM